MARNSEPLTCSLTAGECTRTVPSFDSRKINELPLSAWKALYPLPYESPVRREATKNDLDPMVVAGLIRQEGADLTARQLAVFLICYIEEGPHTVRGAHFEFAA